VLVVLRFQGPNPDEFVPAAHEALETLAARPGYVGGQLARAYDDPTHWCLLTEWESVGAYRRALSAYDVRVRAAPLMAQAVLEPTAYEPLATAQPGGAVVVAESDRASGPVAEGSVPRSGGPVAESSRAGGSSADSTG
jgi:heme oxygenase (mycobilin-producing)